LKRVGVEGICGLGSRVFAGLEGQKTRAEGRLGSDFNLRCILQNYDIYDTITQIYHCPAHMELLLLPICTENPTDGSRKRVRSRA
jgi:hypothetical protein